MGTKAGDAPEAYLLGRNETNRRLLGDLMRSEGLDVRSSGDVEEAVARAGEDPVPDIAIVDVDGFASGVWDVCRRLARRGVPVVVLTKSRTGKVQDRTLGLGVRVVLEKPLRKANLQAIVRSLVGGPGAASGPGGPVGPGGPGGDGSDGSDGGDEARDAGRGEGVGRSDEDAIDRAPGAPER